MLLKVWQVSMMVGNGPPLKKAGKFKFSYSTKYNGKILSYYIPMTPLWNRRSSRIAQSSVSSWTRIIRNSVSGSANFFWQIAFSTFISSGGNDYFSVIFILFIFWSNQNIIAWRLLWGWWGQTSDTKVIRRFQKSC